MRFKFSDNCGGNEKTQEKLNDSPTEQHYILSSTAIATQAHLQLLKGKF